MAQVEIQLKQETAQRFKTFIESDYCNTKSSKTENWARREENNINSLTIRGNGKIIYCGDGPGLDVSYAENFGHIGKIRIKQKIKKYLLNKLNCYIGYGYDPCYHFNNIWPKGRGILSIEDVRNEYPSLTNYTIVKAYNFFNQMHQYLPLSGIAPERILEIGPGSGNLMRLFKKHYAGVKIFIVDLPSSIPYSFMNLLSKFPGCSFLLPHEVDNSNLEKVDFVFLTNNQCKLLYLDYFDVAINTMSFAEMRMEDIVNYFHLLRRVVKRNNMFYCVNRVEKIMTYDNKAVPIRFSEYPWDPKDYDYLYEVSNIDYGRTYNPFYVKATKLRTDGSK